MTSCLENSDVRGGGCASLGEAKGAGPEKLGEEEGGLGPKNWQTGWESGREWEGKDGQRHVCKENRQTSLGGEAAGMVSKSKWDGTEVVSSKLSQALHTKTGSVGGDARNYRGGRARTDELGHRCPAPTKGQAFQKKVTSLEKGDLGDKKRGRGGCKKHRF